MAKKKEEPTKIGRLFDKGKSEESFKRFQGKLGFGEPEIIIKEVVSTGSIGLDIALGHGGLPFGRIIEIYGAEGSGKTTLSLHAIKETQALGYGAAFIDAEHSYDEEYAQNLGVDTESLIIGVPENGEEALAMVDSLIDKSPESGIRTIIIDSVAALTPKAEIDAEFGDAMMGLHSRLMSQACRKLAGKAAKNGVLLVFINQIRQKIGVIYGCFHYDSRVVLDNGETEKIGYIVNNKLSKKVLTYQNGKILHKKIIDWHDNGNKDNFILINVDDYTKAGRRKFICTQDHLINTEQGWRKAKELKVGDKVYCNVNKRLSDEHKKFLVGCILGDGCVTFGRNKYTGYYREGHCIKQLEYLKWKRDILGDIISSFNDRIEIKNIERGKIQEQCNMYSVALWEFKELYNLCYDKNRKKKFTKEITKFLDWRSLAVWYLDDGSFSEGTNGGWLASISLGDFDEASVNNVLDFFEEKLGKKPYYNKWNNSIIFRAKERDLFFSKIAEFVHPSMEHKLSPKFRNKFIGGREISRYYKNELELLEINNISGHRDLRSKKGFDLTIEGSDNYFVSNVNVHNSPDTTTGGNALKFWSTIRLKTSKSKAIKEEDEAIGIPCRVRVEKNKVAPPLKETEFIIDFGKGINRNKEIFDLAVELDIVKKSGSWYEYDGIKEQGESNFITAISDKNQELLDKIKACYPNIYK